MERPDDPSKYYVTWKMEVHPEGLTREEVEAMEDRYAAHDAVIFSMLHAPDGGLSTLVTSKHHTGRELTAQEYFKAWTLFTELTRRKLVAEGVPDHKDSKLNFLKTVWEVICSSTIRDH